MAVASSTRSDIVRMELEEAGILQHFDAVLGGDMVARSKPEPDIFLAAARAVGAEPPAAMCWKIPTMASGRRIGQACIPLWCRICRPLRQKCMNWRK